MSVNKGYPWEKDGNLYDQHYEQLKSSSLATGELFVDPCFPPTDSSLYYSETSAFAIKVRDKYSLAWMRPSEKLFSDDDPKFIVDGTSRFDINQGIVGNCWVMAAMSNVAMDSSLLFKVVPKKQSFQKNYAGIFHFKFWQYGKWIDVVVDDYLPVLPANYSPRLAFVKSKSENEFWPALLEKAYAKLQGSYQLMESGSMQDAIVDFTGGIGESYSKRRETIPDDLFHFLKKAFTHYTLAGASNITGNVRDGIISYHEYSITKIVELEYGSLVRLRNPHGETEWTGPWSDGDSAWDNISDEQKKSIGLDFNKEDGEFWMNIEDFQKLFDTINICSMKGMDHEIHGSWILGESAGGSTNYWSTTFSSNPQYRFKCNEDCLAIISLMQKHRRALKDDGEDNLSIGFDIFSLSPDPNEFPDPLDTNFFLYKSRGLDVGGTKTHINSREVTARITLRRGTYCLIPSTFNQNKAGDFYIRYGFFN